MCRLNFCGALPLEAEFSVLYMRATDYQVTIGLSIDAVPRVPIVFRRPCDAPPGFSSFGKF